MPDSPTPGFPIASQLGANEFAQPARSAERTTQAGVPANQDQRMTSIENWSSERVGAVAWLEAAVTGVTALPSKTMGGRRLKFQDPIVD